MQPNFKLRERIYTNNDRSIAIFKTRKRQTILFIAVKVYSKKRQPLYNKEYSILKNLSSKSIIKVYNYYEDEKNYYMEMEYCASSDLSQYLWSNKHCNYFEKVIKVVSTQILLGLKNLHSNGIIHCNLKPSNIVLDEFGNVKICDLKKALNKNEMTNEDIKINKGAMTPCYTAPELFTEKGIFSFKSDFWALGCIMYEMAVGQVPYYDHNMNKLIMKILNDPVDFSMKNFQEYSDEFIDVLKRLLDKDCNNRCDWDEIENFSFWDYEIFKNPRYYSNNNNNYSSNNNSTSMNSNNNSSTNSNNNNNSNSMSNSNNNNCNNNLNINPVVKKSLSFVPSNLPNINQSSLLNNQYVNHNSAELPLIYERKNIKGGFQKSKDDINEDSNQKKKLDQEINFENNENDILENNYEQKYENMKISFSQSLMNITKIVDKKEKKLSNYSLSQIITSTDKPIKLPQIEDIIIQDSDKTIKPIIGNKSIEIIKHPHYKVEKIDLSPVYQLVQLKELISNNKISHIQTYIAYLYQLMKSYVNNFKYDLLLNILNYFESIILQKDMSNNIINSPFVELIISFLNINNDDIRIRSCSIIGFLIRYSTTVQNPLDKYNLTEILISFISDNNLELNRKAIATLGEYLFFVATQIEDEEDENCDIWKISNESVKALLLSLNHSDEIIRCYSLKTIENISILTNLSKNIFSTEDFLDRIVNIYNENCENLEIHSSALNICSHLIRQEQSLLKDFLDKLIDPYNIILEKESERNQQILINCLLFGLFENLDNLKNINCDDFIPECINLLPSSNIIISSKIIILFTFLFKKKEILLKYDKQVFDAIFKLKKDNNFYYYVKIFENFIISQYDKLVNHFIILNDNNEIINYLNIFNSIGSYHKISSSLFKPHFLNFLISILYKNPTNEITSKILDLIKAFSENTYCVEKNANFIITNIFTKILFLAIKLDKEFQRAPLNICANILSILLDDDNLYCSTIIEKGKTNQINSMIAIILPTIFEILQIPDTMNDALSFLALIIVKNTAFITLYLSVGIIDFVFNLMYEDKYYFNLSLIKILIKLIESNDIKFKDIIEMELIDRVNFMLGKEQMEEMGIYTEYVIEMFMDLMFKINDEKKLKYSGNYDKEIYKNDFLSKISKVSINFKLCIKLLNCENINIQTKSCICLIFILQFFPNGESDFPIKFTSEDVPNLLKGLDSNSTKIHKKIIKIFKWIIDCQKDYLEVLKGNLIFLQTYVEKIRDTSNKQDVIELAEKFLKDISKIKC